MFIRNQPTTNTPQRTQNVLPVPATELEELLRTKQQLVTALVHAASMPQCTDIDDSIQRYSNKLIETIIQQLDGVNTQIRELKSSVFTQCYRNACEYQLKLICSVFTEGSRYGIDFSAITSAAYTDGRLYLNEHNAELFGLSKEQTTVLTTASDIFLNPEDVALIVTSDKRIEEIATDILNYVTDSDTTLFMQFSPFAKHVYLRCIKALVTCIPGHNMIYFNRYLLHFDSVQSMSNHIYTLTLKAFPGASMSTIDEWQFEEVDKDTYKPNAALIQFGNEMPITQSEREELLFPHTTEPKINPQAVGSYNIRIMMLDIFTMIARVYKGFSE